MLIRFVIKNYRSIGQEVEFNMLPTPYKKVHPGHIINESKIRALKPAVIYGANGAGKSNLLIALKFLQEIVTGEETIPDSTTFEENRLRTELRNDPIHFEVEYGFRNHYYAYSIDFKNGVVLCEQLYELGFVKEDILIFERKHNTESNKIEITPGKGYFDAKGKSVLSLLQDNFLTPKMPLLHMSRVLKNDFISTAYDWFEEGLEIIFPSTKYAPLVSSLTDTEFRSFANRILRSYDTGIEQLSVEQTPLEAFGFNPDLIQDLKSHLQEKPGINIIVDDTDGTTVTEADGSAIVLKPKSGHTDSGGNNVIFDLPEESDGSQRLVQYIPIFKQLFAEDTVVFVDEIERSIHPSLLKGLINKLLSQGEDIIGQFIFTTHECNLLDLKIFRQDEIWFVQKEDNQTSLYPLSDFDIRQDLDIEKGYLQGRFGAIPFLGNMKDLKWR